MPASAYSSSGSGWRVIGDQYQHAQAEERGGGGIHEDEALDLPALVRCFGEPQQAQAAEVGTQHAADQRGSDDVQLAAEYRYPVRRTSPRR